MLRSAAMLRPLIFSALIAAGLCGVAHADVYRWVDDQGEAHYSDRWVPGSELIKSDKPHPQTPTSAVRRPRSIGCAANTPSDRLRQQTARTKTPLNRTSRR